MQELWKDIQEFDGAYKVSNYGQIKARNGKLIKPFDNSFGYLVVHLYKDKKEYKRYIHRLVAIAFIDNTEAKKQVNHIDGNKYNNHVDNLEWTTQSENMKHAFINGLHPKGRRSIIQIDTNTNEKIAEYKQIQDAEKATGIRHEYISRACRYNKTAGGYKWEYTNLKIGA